MLFNCRIAHFEDILATVLWGRVVKVVKGIHRNKSNELSFSLEVGGTVSSCLVICGVLVSGCTPLGEAACTTPLAPHPWGKAPFIFWPFYI